MLVLSRKPGEEIVVPLPSGIIRLRILDIPRGCKVRLGIEAPKEVPVHRSEVFEAIAAQEALAS